MTLITPSRATGELFGPVGRVVKFGWITDTHHDPDKVTDTSQGGKVYQDAEEKVAAISALFAARGDLSFCIQNGDFIDGGDSEAEGLAHLTTITAAYDPTGVDVFHTIGNHDPYRLTKDQIRGITGQPANYYYFERGGVRFIVLDGNYSADDDVAGFDVTADDGPTPDPYTSYINPSQRAWLDKTLAQSRLPCVIFSHFPVYYSGAFSWGLTNAAAVRTILEKYYDIVIGCLSGHVHENYTAIVNGITYAATHATVTGAYPQLNYSIVSVYPDARVMKLEGAGFNATHVPQGARTYLLPISAFAANPALDGSNANNNCNFRHIVTLEHDMGAEFRVAIAPGNTNALSSNHVGLGKWGGEETLPWFDGAPIEALFSGVPGFTNQTALVWSDWMPSGALEGKRAGSRLLLSCNTGGAGQSDMAYKADPLNTIAFFKSSATAEWDVQEPTGFSGTAFNFGAAAIETRGVQHYPAPADDYIPTSYTDGIFSSNDVGANPVTIPSGRTLVRRSLEEYAATLAASVLCTNGSTDVRYVAVKSRECVRIGSSGDFTLQYCYLEAIGQDDDHADTIQIYSIGARGGTVNVLNSYIKAHTIAATAGFFCADNWGGTINFSHVVFDGGPFGLKVTADDTCTINLSLENVYFVGPFGTNPYVFQENATGQINIAKWDNVRYATIVGGVLVPGDLIPQPPF